MSEHASRRVVAAAILAASLLAGCERTVPYDPDAAARVILRECGDDSTCVHERWRRDTRGWGLGLRAEVAGMAPGSPFVVETTREIASPKLAEAPCAASPAGAAFDYRTSVTRKGSGEFALALFRWESYEDALVGHRQVVALVARARGDDAGLWAAVAAQTSLDQACLRFRGHRDRCAAAP
jgi:hypothetical protein